MPTKNEALRDIMIEVISDDRCDAEVVRVACEVIAEEAEYNERMADRQGRSDAAAFFAAMKTMYERVEEGRNSWSAFMGATVQSPGSNVQARTHLLNSLRKIRDGVRGEARWDRVGGVVELK